MNAKETGAMLGTVDFVIDHIEKIKSFLDQGDYPKAHVYLRALSLILEAHKDTIRKMMK